MHALQLTDEERKVSTIKRLIPLVFILTVCATAQVKATSKRSDKWRNMIRRIVNAFACAALTLLAGLNTYNLQAQSQDQTAQAAPAQNDYSKAETWLCRPGRRDA